MLKKFTRILVIHVFTSFISSFHVCVKSMLCSIEAGNKKQLRRSHL